MANVLVSGIGSAIAGGGSAATAAPLPAAGGRAASAASSRQGPVAGDAQRTADDGRADTPTAPPVKTQADAAAPGASAQSQAIGTQLVLVFDDQTRSMTIKILDIRTQKVEEPTAGEAKPASEQPTSEQPARFRAGVSGLLVDTKA